MSTKNLVPENIQSFLEQANLRLLQGKHGEASTLLWQAAAASIREAAQAHGIERLSDDQMESFIEILDAQADPGIGVMAGYLNALDFKDNGDGQMMDCETVAFYEPAIRSFIAHLLAKSV